MEDGRESLLIKNMKMNKISHSFGPIWTATVILSPPHMNFIQLKRNLKVSCASVFIFSGARWFYFFFFTHAEDENKVLHSDG